MTRSRSPIRLDQEDSPTPQLIFTKPISPELLYDYPRPKKRDHIGGRGNSKIFVNDENLHITKIVDKLLLL